MDLVPPETCQPLVDARVEAAATAVAKAELDRELSTLMQILF